MLRSRRFRLPSRLAAGLAALALGGSAPARAAEGQLPLVLTQQGRLLDASDQPANGQHRLTFTLYRYASRPTSGTGLNDDTFWSGSYDVTVDGGVYSVVLGQGGAGNQPLLRTMFGGERYLGVKVDGGPELSPRLRVGSVPHAALAENLVRNGQELFDDEGHFLGPAENLDVGKLQGRTAQDFAPAGHDHDAAYLKLSDAQRYAAKSDLTAALEGVYDKAAVDQKAALLDQKIAALDQKIAQLGQTYVTRTEAQAYAKASEVASTYLTQTGAAQLYAPKNETLPVGTLVLNEDSTNGTLDAAGFKLFGSLPSGWATKPGGSLSTAYRARGAFVDGKVYFPGGYITTASTAYGCTTASNAVRTVQVFNTRTNSWTSAANMPTPRYGHSVLSVNNKVYTVGGITCGNGYSVTGEVYNPATNSWATLPQLPDGNAHVYAAAAEVAGKLYVVGGNTSSTTAAGTLHVFDTATNSWSAKASYPRSVYGAAAGAIDGKLYVTGGVWVNGTTNSLLAETYEYDPDANAWTQKTSMPAGLRFASAAVVAGKLHVFGGLTSATANTSTYITNAHYVYDPSGDSWTQAEPLPWTAYATGAVSIGTRAFVFGGISYDSASLTYPAVNTFAEYSAGLYIFRKE